MNEQADDTSTYFIDMVECNTIDSWYQSIDVEGVNIAFKLDSGSDANILPLEMVQRVKLSKKLKLVKTNIVLETYGGFKMKPEGTIDLNCSYIQR